MFRVAVTGTAIIPVKNHYVITTAPRASVENESQYVILDTTIFVSQFLYIDISEIQKNLFFSIVNANTINGKTNITTVD